MQINNLIRRAAPFIALAAGIAMLIGGLVTCALASHQEPLTAFAGVLATGIGVLVALLSVLILARNHVESVNG